eukprot:2777717-Karenia_brevis.AAC.1
MHEMSKKEIQAKLKVLGLPLTGNKTEMLERLTANAAHSQPMTGSPAEMFQRLQTQISRQ